MARLNISEENEALRVALENLTSGQDATLETLGFMRSHQGGRVRYHYDKAVPLLERLHLEHDFDIPDADWLFAHWYDERFEEE